jgi:hypothetical protein
LNIIGKIKSVRVVAVTKPPITTIARGLDVSDPIPVEVAAGISPIAAMRAVMATGRIRDITPERMASSSDSFSCRFFLNLERRITLFCIQIPKRAINPIPAEILKLVPVKRRAAIPPIIAKGILTIINPASMTFPKRTNRIKKISNMLIGTTILSLFEALC